MPLITEQPTTSNIHLDTPYEAPSNGKIGRVVRIEESSEELWNQSLSIQNLYVFMVQAVFLSLQQSRQTEAESLKMAQKMVERQITQISKGHLQGWQIFSTALKITGSAISLGSAGAAFGAHMNVRGVDVFNYNAMHAVAKAANYGSEAPKPAIDARNSELSLRERQTAELAQAFTQRVETVKGDSRRIDEAIADFLRKILDLFRG